MNVEDLDFLKAFLHEINYDKKVVIDRYFSSPTWRTHICYLVPNNFKASFIANVNDAEETEFLDFIEGNGFKVTSVKVKHWGTTRINIEKNG